MTRAVLATALPIVALNIGIQRRGAAHSPIVMSMELFLTLVLAAILLSERLGSSQMLGGMVILLSVTFFELSSLRHAARAAARAAGKRAA